MSNKEVKSVDYGLEKIFDGAQDFLPLLGTDYVEFYVGNAKQSAHFYKTAFGFQSYAYKGLETGSRDSVSYALKQDKIVLILTTPLNSSSPINEHIVKHGDGVKVIALWVEDAKKHMKKPLKEVLFLTWNLLLRKMNTEKLLEQVFIRMAKQFICLLKEKITKEPFYQVLLLGNRSIIQSLLD